MHWPIPGQIKQWAIDRLLVIANHPHDIAALEAEKRAAEARALGETRGAPLLTMERAAYDDQGRAIEHGQHLYRASRYSFDLSLTGW